MKFITIASISTLLIIAFFTFTPLTFIDVSANSSIDTSAGVHQFNCSTPQSAIPTSTPTITVGSSTYFAGTNQISSSNQNPVVARFTGGIQDWCYDTYEVSPVDGRAYGLLATPVGDVYVVFSVDGGDSGFNFGSTGGWLTSYGSGGGPKVSVISRINPNDGSPLNGTFVRAILPNGNTNTLRIESIQWNTGSNTVVVAGVSTYSPLRTDRTAFACQGSSPFTFNAEFNPSLTTALSTATNCETAVTTSSNTGSSSSQTSPSSSLIRSGSVTRVITILVVILTILLITIVAVISFSQKQKGDEDTYDIH